MGASLSQQRAQVPVRWGFWVRFLSERGEEGKGSYGGSRIYKQHGSPGVLLWCSGLRILALSLLWLGFNPCPSKCYGCSPPKNKYLRKAKVDGKESYFFSPAVPVSYGNMEVPGLGMESELRPTPQPQQCQIQATSVTKITACGNAGF